MLRRLAPWPSRRKHREGTFEVRRTGPREPIVGKGLELSVGATFAPRHLMNEPHRLTPEPPIFLATERDENVAVPLYRFSPLLGLEPPHLLRRVARKLSSPTEVARQGWQTGSHVQDDVAATLTPPIDQNVRSEPRRAVLTDTAPSHTTNRPPAASPPPATSPHDATPECEREGRLHSGVAQD